jgi:uncharacterized membrane protein
MKFMTYWKVLLALIVVSLCSGLIGAAVALRIQNHRLARQVASNPATEVFVERLVKNLQLTPDQLKQIRPILMHGQIEIRAISTNAIQQTVLVRKQIEAEVKPLLTPEQLKRLDKMIERRERLRERMLGGERLTPEQRNLLREKAQKKKQQSTNKVPVESSPQ